MAKLCNLVATFVGHLFVVVTSLHKVLLARLEILTQSSKAWLEDEPTRVLCESHATNSWPGHCAEVGEGNRNVGVGPCYVSHEQLAAACKSQVSMGGESGCGAVLDGCACAPCCHRPPSKPKKSEAYLKGRWSPAQTT